MLTLDLLSVHMPVKGILSGHSMWNSYVSVPISSYVNISMNSYPSIPEV